MGFKKYCLITIMDCLQTFILAIASRVAVFNYLNIVLMKHVILVRKLLLSQHMKEKKYGVYTVQLHLHPHCKQQKASSPWSSLSSSYAELI